MRSCENFYITVINGQRFSVMFPHDRFLDPRKSREDHKGDMRIEDRRFFINLLGDNYMKDKVLHHLWESHDGIPWVLLLDKDKHPNGGVGNLRSMWRSYEEWIYWRE